MISEKAVETAARAHDAEDAAQRGEPDPWSIGGDDFAEFRSDRIASMRAALSAALPLLLEGKQEELKELIWGLAEMDEFVAYRAVDRIIAMLGGGE